MNQLAVLNKHLRGAKEAYGKITGVETKRKANEALSCFMRDLSFSEVSVGGEKAKFGAGEFELQINALDKASALVGAAVFSDGRGTVTEGSPNTITVQMGAIPESITVGEGRGELVEEVGVKGQERVLVGGADAVVEAQSVTESPQTAKAGEVGGWPVLAEVAILGLAPNRRSLKGKLVSDGRTVSLERTLKAWKAGDTTRAKLVRAGQYPLFRAVA